MFDTQSRRCDTVALGVSRFFAVAHEPFIAEMAILTDDACFRMTC